LTPPSSPPSSPSSSSGGSSFFGCTTGLISVGCTTWVGVTLGVTLRSTCGVDDAFGGGGGGGGGGAALKKVSESAGGAISSTCRNDQMIITTSATAWSAPEAMIRARRLQEGLVCATYRSNMSSPPPSWYAPLHQCAPFCSSCACLNSLFASSRST